MLLQMALFHFLWLSSIPLYIHIGTHHIFFIHSSVDGHLGYFHVLAIMNSTAMTTGVYVSFCLDICLRVGLLDHMVMPFLVF